MDIELVYFQGCPHAAEARRRLRRALEALGLTPVWQEWDLGASDLPRHVIDRASPTVLVNGRDVTGTVGAGGGLRCATDGAPAVETIVAALRKAGLTLDPGP